MTDDQLESRHGHSDSWSLLRWQWAGLFVFALLVAAFPLYRTVEASRRADTLSERETALVTAGRDLWEQNCASCHGPTGEGDTGIPALNAREFLEGATDEQIHHIIAAGVPGTAMAPWWVEFGGPLTDEQIRSIVAFIRSWEPTAPSRPDWQDPQPPEEEVHDEEEPPHEEEPPPAEEPPPEEEPPPAEEAQPLVVMTDRVCEPLEVEVTAGEPFTLQVRNDGSGQFSFELPSIDVHSHVASGETVEFDLQLDAGEYEFECLGATHDQLLGIGQILAR